MDISTAQNVTQNSGRKTCNEGEKQRILIEDTFYIKSIMLGYKTE